MNFLSILFIVLAIEAGLYLLVQLCRKSFPWLITEKDETPHLDQKALKKFVDYSFDPDLGWVRKPNSIGVERGKNGDITFHVDAIGSRLNSFSELEPSVAAFGDSYTFCRQVEDDETWQAFLAQNINSGVLNFGVGNYGIDQALMRYERTTLPDSVRVVIMGFVPESICRIQSYWKHYLEFGNTFAFKPKFKLEADGQLTELPNLVRKYEDFERLEEILTEIQQHDVFYKTKFLKLQFRWPYTISFLRNPFRNIKLISFVVVGKIARLMRISNPWIESLPFTLIMRENIIQSHKFYSDGNATDLMAAILRRFKETAMQRGHVPVVLLMPQLFDLKLIKDGHIPYCEFFNKLSTEMSVIDMTEEFLQGQYENYYVNDQYGGHLSALGNQLVANKIVSCLETNARDFKTDGVE